jgi:tRNA-Thr(GGU) m(6)t(6)A37 methyltransferase TsaA
MGYSSVEELGEKLQFLQDPLAAKRCVSRFFASPAFHERVLQEARIRTGDPNLTLDPNWVADPNEIGSQILETYGIDLETFFVDFNLFGGSDMVNVELHCHRKPYQTNGQWDEDNKQVTWSSRITTDRLPFICYAIIGEPNEAFQKEHFGRAILMDEPLVQYAFWYKGLTNEQKGEWDDFLVGLDANEDIPSTVESFRFKRAPAPSPDSDGAVMLLSDLARKLITEGLKADKVEPDASGGREPPQTFSMNPIGRVSKKGDQTFIILDEKYADGLKGLESHDYVTVVYWFDRNDTPEKRAVLQVHPRGDRTNPLTGVFATHSPLRPNLIAISKCNIVSVQGSVIEIEEIDALDGSPVLDLKGDFFRFHRRSP